jgi:hypothetical protein
MIRDPMAILCVLLGLLALLFALAAHERTARIFKVVPLLVFAYFVPTLLSNTGVIPLESPLYTFIRNWLLPASLVLLVLSIDVAAILRLGATARRRNRPAPIPTDSRTTAPRDRQAAHLCATAPPPRHPRSIAIRAK